MLSGKGTVALVGAGEFLAGVKQMDNELLASLSNPAQVVILPTAAALDGTVVARRWGSQGVAHFQSLGASAEEVLLLTRDDAYQPALVARIRAANFIYLSGGKPPYLVQTLRDTPAWQAICEVFEAGGVVAGCSAGAMALVGQLPQFAGFGAQEALGLVKDMIVIPHFDEIPGVLTGLSRMGIKDNILVAGIDGSAGLIGSAQTQSWRVSAAAGKGVTIFQGKQRQRYTNGDSVVISGNN